MDEELRKELKELKRLAVVNFAEIQHLKKFLYRHFEISEGDFYDYQNSLYHYIEDLDRKNKNLLREFDAFAD